MTSPRQIRFDLLGNARDSIRQAVELLAWKDIGDEHSRLKHAIVGVAHAIELLLKEKLRQTHPAFVWENVDKYPSLDARTVTVDTAVSCLRWMCGVRFSDQDATNVGALRKTRNAIEHYEWSASESEAKTIIGNALSFVFAFSKEELGYDLSAEFKKDDTWRVLIDELYQFARAHGARIEARLQREGAYPVCCDSCGKLAVPSFGGACELCGHWNDTEGE